MSGRGWGWASERYPAEMRRSWSARFVRAAHSRYNSGHHDALTVAGESEYRRRRRQGLLALEPAPPTPVRMRDGKCSMCGRPGRLAKSVCARCRDAFGVVIASLRDLPARAS